ncbi:MAG: hypothetical protein RL199_336 [Pseudomonadota bacterium]|jgi:hypothetical protein
MTEAALSSDILRANLSALWKRDFRLFDLASAEPSSPDLRLEFAANGLPNLVRTTADGREVRFYRSDDPLAGVAADIDPLVSATDRYLVLVGLGLGYELAYFLETHLERCPVTTLLIVEPDVEVFRHAMRQVDLSLYLSHPKIHLVVGYEGRAFEQQVETIGIGTALYALSRRLGLLYGSGTFLQSRETMLDLVARLRDATKTGLERAGTNPMRGVSDMCKTLAKYPDVLRWGDAGAFRDLFRDRPVVTVSAGPSLSQALPTLKLLQGRVVIVAADGAVAALVRSGIRPDFVCAIDPSPKIRHHLEGFDLPDTILVANSVLDPSVVPAWSGPKLLAWGPSLHIENLFPGGSTFDPRMSSGNMAISFALWLGAPLVILTGQDFAFSPDGRSHAAETRHAERGLMERPRGIFVPGNAGGMVETHPTYDLYRRDLERFLAVLRPSRVVNTSLLGAVVAGTELMSMDAAAREVPETEVPRQRIHRALERALATAEARFSGPDRVDPLSVMDDEGDAVEALRRRIGETVALAEAAMAAVRRDGSIVGPSSVDLVRRHPHFEEVRRRRMRIFTDERGRRSALLDLLLATQGMYGIVVDLRMFEVELLAGNLREMLWNALNLQREWLLVTDRLAGELHKAAVDCRLRMESTSADSGEVPAA